MKLLRKTSAMRPQNQAFLLAFLTGVLLFIPFIIFDKGYFLFFGDFNVQQIPFYKLAHEAIRTGNIGWNWYTDLGANFIGSYSFYLLGSPFFWLTLPFPTEFVPHLMGPLLILKHACAAFSGTLYLKRFLHKKQAAVIGGLLYAFSGYAVYNIFFNHFHEAIVFFPLLLVGLEELMVNDRRGVFALSVLVNAFVNYWFFIGEVVFVLLYFAVRSFSPDWKLTLTKFFWTAFESVLGLLASSVLLLPSVLALMGNPRTGVDSLLSGWNLWLYWHNQMYPAIFTTALFPPDLPSRPNLFPDRGAKWASLGIWLPLLSTCGIAAYFKSRRDWLRNMLLVCIACAFVPALNSLFILLNHSYYARWYYMAILLMCLATARALESPSIKMDYGIKWTMFFTVLFTLILTFTPIKVEDEWQMGLTDYPARFYGSAVIALLSVLLFWGLWQRRHKNRYFYRNVTVGVCAVSVIYGIVFIAEGKTHSDDRNFIIDVALNGRYELDLEQEPFARVDLLDSMDNLGMFWHLPNLQTFHSVVPNSIMEFYPQVGVKRDVSSKPEKALYQLRGLLSCRWLYVPSDKVESAPPMPGFRIRDVQMGYYLYENELWIPMGFSFDSYMTREQFDALPTDDRGAALLRAILLEGETLERNRDILLPIDNSALTGLGREEYVADCYDRQATAAHTFTIDAQGFTAHSTNEAETLMFFSVPWESGWRATVNGEASIVEKVDVGFMAVRVPAGENVIRFTYHTPGLAVGGILTLCGGLLILVYMLWYRRKGPIPSSFDNAFDTAYSALPSTVFPSESEIYLSDDTDTHNEGELEDFLRDQGVNTDAFSDSVRSLLEADAAIDAPLPSPYVPPEDTPSEDAPSKDTPSEDTPSKDTPSKDAPSKDAPLRDTPPEDTPSRDTPSRDTPSKDAPSRDTPSRDTPSKDTPSRDTPSRDTPSRDTPSKDTPSKDAPSKDAPSRDTPSKDTPSKDTPSSS